MLPILFVLLIATLLDAKPESPWPTYNYGVPRNSILKRQTAVPYITTGVHGGKGPNGSLPLRIEVRELEKDPVLWTLYVLGLDMLQYTNQSEMLSWYQLSGVHGLPFVPFNDVQPSPNNPNSGYCTHVSILFPTWHRPYIATYEQIIYGLVQEIAQMFPAGQIRDKYIAAAAKFRVPYWDWAAIRPSNESIFPQSICGSRAIVVDGPAGVQTIGNPLYSYRFQPLDSNALPNPPFNQFLETIRSPTTNDSSAISRNNIVAQRLDDNSLSIRSRLYNLLTNNHNYSQFSNEGWISPTSGYDSLESIHDQIHGLTGNGGHMSYIYYAAFDPLFWLHHTMLDRCFSMWQILNPDSYVVPTNATYSTFTMAAGDIQDVSTALTPFYKDGSGFWTSADVRATDVFGYSYPETANFIGANVTSNVISAINELYGPALLTKRENVGHHEWIVNIVAGNLIVDGSFFIYIFIGPFSKNSDEWPYDPNLAGTHSVFTKMSRPGCDCDGTMIAATLPLTHVLQRHVDEGKLRSLDPDDVKPFLKGNMEYRMTLADGTRIGHEMPSLKVSVVSAKVNLPSDALELPVWGDMRDHTDVVFNVKI